MGKLDVTFINEKYIPNQLPNGNKTEDGTKYVSFSQYQGYQKCPHSWKLRYIDKIKDKEETIHTVFGNAMHITIQNWIKVMYMESVKKSNELDLSAILLEQMKVSYADAVAKMSDHFSTKEELTEFYLDGLSTLDFLRKKRTNWFSTKHTDLVGVEIPISLPASTQHENITLVGYLDTVLIDKRSKRFTIIDYKTSKKGWSKWDKEDDVKMSQLVLYKLCFAKQYGINVEDIDIEYLILKRKIDEESMFAQKRAVGYSPASGSITQNKVRKMFQAFIDNCFAANGDYNLEGSYPAIKGKYGNNCKFCEFADKPDLCPYSSRK